MGRRFWVRIGESQNHQAFKESRMEKHIHILGLMMIIFGIMGLIGASVVFVIFVGGGIIGSAASGESEIMVIAGIFGIIITGIILLTSVPAIITDWGIMKFKPWGRMLGIIVAILNLPSIPIGTVLGIYALWVLFNEETVKLFQQRVVYPSGQ